MMRLAGDIATYYNLSFMGLTMLDKWTQHLDNDDDNDDWR